MRCLEACSGRTRSTIELALIHDVWVLLEKPQPKFDGAVRYRLATAHFFTKKRKWASTGRSRPNRALSFWLLVRTGSRRMLPEAEVDWSIGSDFTGFCANGVFGAMFGGA